MSLERISSIMIFLVLELTRVWTLNGRKKLPMFWGQGWFFNLQVGPDFYQGPGADIIGRYKKRVALPYILEVICLAPVFFFANYFYILPAVVVTTVIHFLWGRWLVKSFLKEVEPFAISQPEASRVPVALSLTRRRLVDYTNVSVERSEE